MHYMELIKQISLRYESECNRMLQDYGMTIVQLELQHFLYTQQEQGIPVSQRSIEYTLHLKNPTVSGILSRLESKGFIERCPDPEDKRVNRVTLTEKSLSLRAEMDSAAEQAESALTDNFTEDEKAQLLYLLTKMYKNLCLSSPSDSKFNGNCL